MSETSVVVKVEEISPIKKKLQFDVSWADVKREMEPIFQEVSKTAKIKGFRQGKIPRNILEMHYGDYVEGETITNLINKFYWDALRTHDITAVGRPEIEQGKIEKEKNFTFTATVETAPNIEPQGYTGLELETFEQDVTEDDVEAGLERLRQMFATIEDVEEGREIKQGDYVSMDFNGSVDGVSRDDLQAQNFVIEIGARKFIPGFEERLIGSKVGDVKEICLNLPEEHYAKDVVGKEAIFTITLKGIKEKRLPALDENFIKNFEKYNSLDEMKADIRKSLEDENNVKSKSYLRNAIVNDLLKNNEFEVPPSLIDWEFSSIMASIQRRMFQDGATREDATAIGKQYHEQYRMKAAEKVKIDLLLGSIARKEAIAVEEKEVDDKIIEISRQSPDYEQTVKYFEEGGREHLKQEMLYNKVFEFIEEKSNVKITKKSSAAAEEENK